MPHLPAQVIASQKMHPLILSVPPYNDSNMHNRRCYHRRGGLSNNSAKSNILDSSLLWYNSQTNFSRLLLCSNYVKINEYPHQE